MQPAVEQPRATAPSLPTSPPPIPPRPPPLPTKPAVFAVPAPRPRQSPSPSSSPSHSPAEPVAALVGGRLNRASSVPAPHAYDSPAVVSDGEEQQRRRLHIVASGAGSDRLYHTDADDNTASPSPSPCSPATPLQSVATSYRARSVSITAIPTRSTHSSLSIDAHRRGSEMSLLRPVSPMTPSHAAAFNPLDALSPSRRLISTAHSLPSDAPSLSTFKLAAYSFTSASTKPSPTSPPPFTLTLDPVAQTLTIASIDGCVFQSRPFSSLAMCTHSLDEPTTFTIYYLEGKPISRCVALSSGEAVMQYTMLMSFIDQVRAAQSATTTSTAEPPHTDHHTPSLIYATRILKKSQLRWKPLYLTLHPFLVTLHSTHRLSIDDVLKRVNLQGCTVREWRDGSNDDRERVLLLEQPGGKATQFKCASGIEREVVILLMRKAMSRQTEGGADSDWSERTEESKGEVEERRPSVFSEMHQRLQVSTSTDGKAVQLSLASPSSFSSLSTVGEHCDTSSPLSPSPSPPILSPHRSVAHAAQLRQVKQSRRRSRRSMSKDFQQLKDRETTDTSTSSPSATSFHSAAALKEFVELPADPRPPPTVSAAVGVGVYQLLSTLLTSLMSGCAVSGVMYVPRAVWWQQGRKVQAFMLKVECFELLYEHVLSINPPPASGQQSPSTNGAKEAEDMLYSVRVVMDDIHERLAQHLPYLQPPNAATRCRPRTGQHNKAKDVMQRLLVKGKDVTSVGWRRLDADEVQRYCTAVQHVLEAVTIFNQWHGWLERSDTVGSGGGGGSGWSEVRDVLAGVDVWLYGVLCNVLLHDVFVGVRRYMKYLMRLLQEKHQMGGWSGQKSGGSAMVAAVGRSGLKASSFLQSVQR